MVNSAIKADHQNFLLLRSAGKFNHEPYILKVLYFDTGFFFFLFLIFLFET